MVGRVFYDREQVIKTLSGLSDVDWLFRNWCYCNVARLVDKPVIGRYTSKIIQEMFCVTHSSSCSTS